MPYNTQLLLDFYFDFDINSNNIIQENDYKKFYENFDKIKNYFCNIVEDEERIKTQFLSVKFKNSKRK